MNRSSYRDVRRAVLPLASLLLCAPPACDEPDRLPPASDGTRIRRALRPPPDHVRPVPPHAIHEKGVGPYELGMPLQNILDLLPRGPRVVVAQIDDVLDYDVVRADDDEVIVGAARSRTREVVFVSVLEQSIARTEHGVGVGTSLAQLREALGDPASHPTLAMDPRMVAFARLPQARFVLARRGDKPTVAAVLMGRNPPERAQLLSTPAETSSGDSGDSAGDRGRDRRDNNLPREQADPNGKKHGPRPGAASSGAADAPPSAPGNAPGSDKNAAPPPPSCAQPWPSGHVDKILSYVRVPPARRKDARVLHGCFSAPASATTTREALVSDDSRVVLVSGEPGRLRRLAVHQTDDVVFVATIDIDADGRREIAIVSQRVTGSERGRERISRIEILRYEAGRMHQLADSELYRLSTSNVAWVGASLREIDLLLELWTHPERVEVTGLFVHWGARGRPTNVALLMPLTIPIRRKRASSAPEVVTPVARDASVPGGPLDAGVVDAPAPLPDASVAKPDAGQPGAADPARGDAVAAPESKQKNGE